MSSCVRQTRTPAWSMRESWRGLRNGGRGRGGGDGGGGVPAPHPHGAGLRRPSPLSCTVSDGFLFSFSSFSRLRPYFGCFLASFLPHPVSPFLICCLAAVNCASSCLISSLPPHSLPHERVTRSLLFLPFMDIESGVTRVLQDLKYSILKSRLPCVGAFKRYIACERISVWDMPRGRLLPCRVPFSCRAAVCAGPYTAPVARSPCARIHSGRRSGHGIRNHFLWLFLSLRRIFFHSFVFSLFVSLRLALSLSR